MKIEELERELEDEINYESCSGKYSYTDSTLIEDILLSDSPIRSRRLTMPASEDKKHSIVKE